MSRTGRVAAELELTEDECDQLVRWTRAAYGGDPTDDDRLHRLPHAALRPSSLSCRSSPEDAWHARTGCASVIRADRANVPIQLV
jgi:hypothetical protein